MNTLLTFGEKLRTLRKKNNLTIYKLGELADIPFTLISALENSRRKVGVNNATKLGRALGLADQSLRDFVYLALDNATGKVLEEFRSYPADLINLLPTLLKDAGVNPEDIKGTVLRPDYGDETVADAVMFLNGSKYRAYIHLEMREE